MVSLPAINRKTIEKLIFGIILGTFLLIFWTIGPRFITSLSGERGLLVRFYDVGQGDAILIEKGTTQILIDGGPNDQILTYLGRDLLPWDREIELLVLTLLGGSGRSSGKVNPSRLEEWQVGGFSPLCVNHRGLGVGAEGSFLGSPGG